MGNAAWGNGYHQGLAQGRVQGGGLGVAVTIGGALLLAGGRKTYEKIQKRRASKCEQILLARDEHSVDENHRNNDDKTQSKGDEPATAQRSMPPK